MKTGTMGKALGKLGSAPKPGTGGGGAPPPGYVPTYHIYGF